MLDYGTFDQTTFDEAALTSNILNLAALGTALSKGRAALSGSISMGANGIANSTGRVAFVGALRIAAVGKIASSGRASLISELMLTALSAAAGQGNAKPVGKLALAATGAGKAFGRGDLSVGALLQLFARGMAVARGLLAGLSLIPPAPSPPSAKVITLDAAYGSDDVTRFYLASPGPLVRAGEGAGVVIDVGAILDPTRPVMLVFTKPDGTVLDISSPFAYIGKIDCFTSKGIFESGTYIVCNLTARQIDQNGVWSCYARNGTFFSLPRKFYIGPP